MMIGAIQKVYPVYWNCSYNVYFIYYYHQEHVIYMESSKLHRFSYRVSNHLMSVALSTWPDQSLDDWWEITYIWQRFIEGVNSSLLVIGGGFFASAIQVCE